MVSEPLMLSTLIEIIFCNQRKILINLFNIILSITCLLSLIGSKKLPVKLYCFFFQWYPYSLFCWLNSQFCLFQYFSFSNNVLRQAWNRAGGPFCHHTSSTLLSKKILMLVAPEQKVN